MVLEGGDLSPIACPVADGFWQKGRNCNPKRQSAGNSYHIHPKPFKTKTSSLNEKLRSKKMAIILIINCVHWKKLAKKGKEWYKASNDWILLLVDESIPLSRIDEVRGTLENYFVVQTTVNSDDLVYFMGDVSDMAKFKQGKFNDWMNNQLNNYPEVKSKAKEYQNIL